MINQERLDKINELTLCRGIGKDLDKELCIMQAVDYVTGGSGESDHPPCACPMLTAYAIRINDRLGDQDRQKLKELIPLLVGTVDPELRFKRAKLILFRSVTVIFPILLDLLALNELAAQLRATADTNEAMLRASALIKESRTKIREAALKKRAAAADADADAAAYAYAAAAAAVDAAAYAYAAAAVDAYAYADADAAAYAYAAAAAAAYAYADAAAYAYADADAAAYAYADADAAAYAYADAAAVKRINQERIESLRLACLVTKG